MSVFFDSTLRDDLVSKGDVESLLSSIGVAKGINGNESDEYHVLLAAVHDCAERVLSLPDYHGVQPVKSYPRENVRRCPQDEQEFGHAWSHKFLIRGDATGDLLKNKKVVMKDCISVAEVPQLFGTDAIEPWIPQRDATVVTRVLEAGADVVGTAICENFCTSTSSYTNAQGTVENPYAAGFSAGGSTSGGAALVGGGIVDLAIGADQGGSIRLPASLCGCVGIKPTHGLVPYTGITSGDAISDHAGPIARTVKEAAACLDAIAGQDPYDDRTLGAPAMGTTTFSTSLGSRSNHAENLRIALVEEGFNHPLVNASVRETVLAAAHKFTSLGATVTPVSLPSHLLGPSLWTIQQRIAGTQSILGQQHGRRGLFPTDFEAVRGPWTDESFSRLFPSTKNVVINGLSLMKRYPGVYSKALNLAQQVKDEYEALFQDYDVVIMPTVPVPAPRNLNYHKGVGPMEALRPSMGLTINTAIFNLTGQPALSLPVGFVDVDGSGAEKVRLPVGMQIVGPLWGEQKILDAAFAWEQANDWRTFRQG
ncbi:amidase signature domain-containing protein [Elsinoe ampelina]|uniref:Amidase signature domain-containing protein n=1 Tax=Elsinoe ampelina TaxID=302913 RepID=A0A6A6G9Q8_9PEZI|nr:amidase signature domain-containing protein [Elsinoe ampelina]